MKQIYLSFSYLLKRMSKVNNNLNISFILMLLISVQGFSQNIGIKNNNASTANPGVLASPVKSEIIAPLVNPGASLEAPAAGVPFPCDGKLYFFRSDGGKNWLSYIDQYI